MKKLTKGILIATASVLVFTGCGGKYSNPDYYPEGMIPDSGYRYDSVYEQPFQNVSDEPSAYFMLDRNTASYTQMRRTIESGYRVNADSVRAEEYINYFDYDFAAPAEGEKMAISTYLTDCAWNEEHKLMTIGVKTQEAKLQSSANNYVFLIDVSGSMEGADRLGLIKQSLKTLVGNLGENDYVSIVTYAGNAGVKLNSTRVSDDNREKILSSVSSLTANGSTNGSGGIELAYEQANRNFIAGGNNRVILMSDGDFNVGISQGTPLKEFIQEKAKNGVYLTVLGFGMGNMRDDNLESLARNGNGNYAYIDSEKEAEKLFDKEITGTLYTVAKDAKAGVTFTENVAQYRMIGYDTKLISEDDFNNPEKDAGEIGSNLTVVALYEIVLSETAEQNARLADVEIRYKDVSENEEDKSVKNFVNNDPNPDAQTTFISCVAEYALLLRNSEYKGTASFDNVLTRLSSIYAYTSADYFKTEFFSLVQKAKTIYQKIDSFE